MKKLIDIIESEDNKKIGQIWAKRKSVLDTLLKKTGWPEAEWFKGKMKCLDENTVITFELDDFNGYEPYISNINNKFYSGSETTLKELNGLIDLYKEINSYNWDKLN